MSSSNNCSIQVNITNNTGKGPITFNTFSFLEGTGNSFNANNAQPFTVSNVIGNGATALALYAQGYSASTAGTGLFNMPNDDVLTINWNLKAGGSNFPTLSPSSNKLVYTGLTNPVVSNTSNYVFNVVVSA
jgi:hypothetical protein